MQQFNAMLAATAFYDFKVNKNSDNHCYGHADLANSTREQDLNKYISRLIHSNRYNFHKASNFDFLTPSTWYFYYIDHYDAPT